MGIRIHKVLGYGLTDIYYDNIADDPRFNPYGFFISEQNEKDFPIKQFYVELELITRDSSAPFDLFLLKQQIKQKELTDFHGVMVHDPEFGLKSVCVFIPPTEIDNWHRYDNIIDYIEACNNANGFNHVQKLSKPIYPYDAYMDTRTFPPKPVDRIMRELRVMVNNPKITKWVSNDKITEMYGFKSVEDFKAKVVPLVPRELVETLRFLKIFRDPNTIYSLRPMIYTYWS